MSTKPLFKATPKKVEHDSAIRDNRNHGRVGDWLQEKIEDGSKLSIVSAYFTVSAYKHLRDRLDGIEGLRFLFGDPAFIKVKDAEKKRRAFRFTDEGLSMQRQTTQRAEAKVCAEWLEKKAEIRSMVKPSFLHGKLYHVSKPNGTDDAIMGSSNFTGQGLGFGNSNMELNMVINDRRDREELKRWFEELWNAGPDLVADVKKEVLRDLKELYADTAPEFVYFKTLYHLFKDFIEDQTTSGVFDSKTGFLDSEIWNKLYKFQRDGVVGAINKIKKHEGCIIADSVGLGKTFEALAIIKYFELLNKNVLVLVPKKLASNWTIYQAKQNSKLNPFPRDRFQFTVLCHSDMGRTRGISAPNGIGLDGFNWAAYDLVVIDESHNFRGNPVAREVDGRLKVNRAHFLLEQVIKSGARTKVLLLSATPVNTNLRDLRNQINLITAGEPGALFETTQIKDIGLALAEAQKRFTNWASPDNPTRTVKQLLEALDASFFKLLDEVTIARSRKHVVNHYQEDGGASKFPTRDKPVSIYPEIDLEGHFPSYDTLDRMIQEYKLAVFNPSAFLKAGARDKYEAREGKQIEAFTQERREHFLIGMMKVGYLKRLESSVSSFKVSMERTVSKISDLLKKIEAFEKRPDTQTSLDLQDFTPPEDELEEDIEDEEAWSVGTKKRFALSDINIEDWKKALQKDKEQLNTLYMLARAVDPKNDAKLFELKKLILDKVLHPFNGNNRKVIVFTAFADTAKYIYDTLKDFAQHEVKLNMALVTGTRTETFFGDNDFNSILTNFSPISKEREKRDMEKDQEIDILIASDCISEGQNLQDCDFIVNYDIHWNPVRIIQRFGRIDRLGSLNERIRLVNFWPTEDLDNYIRLKSRVEARMALVDVTATGEENILNTEKIEDLVTEDLKYRDRQLKRLKDDVLDLEEIQESLSLTDFTLDDFRGELLQYLLEHREALEGAPLGLFGVVPSPHHPAGDGQHRIDDPRVREVIRPGVIYCLGQRATEGDVALRSVNPTQPYFLLYVRMDGTVAYSYTQPKQVLEVFRLLCQGKKEAYTELCRLFHEETRDGEDMNTYNALLERGVADISRTVRKRSGVKIANERGALLIPDSQQVNSADDFDLITWLVIK